MGRAVGEASSEDFIAGLTSAQNEIVRAGLIQTFEVAYEMCCKHMKRWLEMNLGSHAVDGVSRKELFRIAAEHRLIEDAAGWFEYHAARKETVHTYNPYKADAVAQIAILGCRP